VHIGLAQLGQRNCTLMAATATATATATVSGAGTPPKLMPITVGLPRFDGQG